MELSIILFIVLFHELGHYAMAEFFNWRVKSIMLWVFGGVMNTDEHGTRPIYEEVLVTIAGPFQHIIIYFGLFVLSSSELLSLSIIEIALYYNTVILLFNLLPIWPLDGGKLVLLVLSTLLPYRKAYYSCLILSIILTLILLLLQLFYFPFTLSTFLILLFILFENRTEWQLRYYVFIRFLLNRYEGNQHIKKVQPLRVSHHSSLMDVFSRFKRERKHPIYIIYPENKRKTVDENDCLKSYFHDRQYNVTIGEAVNKLV